MADVRPRTDAMTISFDSNILLAYYQSRAGLPVTAGLGASAAAPPKQYAPTAPWQTNPTPTDDQTSAEVRSALAGHKLIDENAAKLDLPGASADYKKLFALYQGLGTLSALVDKAQAKGTTAQDLRQLGQAFSRGMAEVSDYIASADFDQVRLAEGDVSTSAKTALGIARSKSDYVTGTLVTGNVSAEVPAFQGDVRFTISAKSVNTTKTVDVDLADMGAQPRTLANVINFVNGKLQAAGVMSRLATQRTPAVPTTTTVAGKTVTLSPGADSWALKVKVDSAETLSFSAPDTAGALYLAQSVGDPDPDKKPLTDDGVTQRELLKFQTDTDSVGAPPKPAGATNWVDGRVFAETLGPEVKTVRATKIGPDGSVYMLADITAKTGGQEIKGEQDVALMKYDSAGNLIYSRTLGASDEASGLGLAVSADGQVAVAGSISGGLNGAQNGATNSGTSGSNAGLSDSFVTLYDKDGQEVWTERRGARLDDEASQVAFGADGTVYVAGRSKSALPGGTALGGWDSYAEAFKADAKGKVQTLFTQSFGSSGDDRPAGMVMDGTSMVVAGLENGHAVLRRYDVSGASPVLTATRDLGDLMGGDIAGLALDGAGNVVLGGTTSNGALAGGTISRAASGGTDAFAVRLSADLAPAAGDRVAYYGGSGADKATSVTVGDGKVWIAGSTATDLPGLPAQGVKDGFVAGLDMDAGAVDWSRRFSGKDRQAAPSAIAFNSTGSSVLDRLGLPSGTLSMTDSQRLTANSALRAGDQFTVAADGGAPATVTIDDKDTIDTLATKVRRAMGFNVQVDVVTVDGTRRLQIKPSSERSTITIGAGKAGQDALPLLGLTPGVVRATTVDDDGKVTSADGKGQIYGLKLDTDLNLSDPDQIRHAAAEIAAAMGVIRSIYKDLVAAATPKSAQTAAAAASGKVPAYLTNQIANYQAALDRLTGGAA
jgi:hypothetical protein